MYNKGNYLTKIKQHLIFLVLNIISSNNLGLTDDSKLSEDFFKGLLNLILDSNLVNLNTKEPNYAGIDLGDSAKRLCVQVTADSSSKKIQHTLEISDKHNRQNDYDVLLILIIGFKKRYSKKFTSSFPSFNKKEHIWDVNTLLKNISEIDDMDLLAKIVEYLDKELETIIKIDPLELSEQDLASIIDVLFDYTQENIGVTQKDPNKKYELTHRSDDFIEQKNNLNGVTQAFFDVDISPNFQYAKKIEQFLGDPINQDYQDKYFSVTELLQGFYEQERNHFDNNLESFFSFIFGETINWENRNLVSPTKLLIILSNMYFNCDIGGNPT